MTTTEDRMRELLTTLTPPAPPTAGDARPVVRRARERRRTTLVAVAAGAAVITAVAVPFWLNRPGADDGLVTGVEQDRDPFATLPCADLPSTVADGFDPASVVAARLCVAGEDLGFPFATPPEDALVDGLDEWGAALGALPAADPGRCAATDVMPSPVRLLVELDDGSRSLVDPNFCGSVMLGATTVDGLGVATTYLQALAAQRAVLPVPDDRTPPRVDCKSTGTLAVPTESLSVPLTARLCPDGTAEPGTVAPEQDLDSARLAELVDSFASGTRGPVPPRCLKGSVGWQLVTVDPYGDVQRWDPTRCGTLAMVRTDRPEESWQVPLSFAD